MRRHVVLRRFGLMAVLLVGVLAFSFPALAAQEDAGDPITRIQNFINQLTDDGLFSGALLVARNGEILLSEGYGLANLDWDIPNTPDTKFRIASITKQFTAMSILLLQEQGKLDIHDSICLYIDDCPEAWGDITIEQLMNHTSGIGNPRSGISTQPMALRRQVADSKSRPLNFEPGTDWSYSNTGYVVLGYIIQQVSGQSYQRFLQDNLFDPLGLENTGYDINNRVLKNRATGYTSSTQIANYLDMTIPHAAGALYSTVGDLYTWTTALMAGKVVPQERLEAMWEAAVPTGNFADERYGYGLVAYSLANHRVMGHDGSINGFVSRQSYFPDNDVIIIALSNFENSAVGQVVESAAKMLFDDD